MAKVAYNKPWLSVDQQVSQLKERGLIIDDQVKAASFLEYANYYRFSAYCIPFEQKRHIFQEGTRFEQIRALYDFDKRLRDLLAEGLETAEIYTRTKIAHILSLKHGAFAHLNRSLFTEEFDWDDWHERIINETNRSTETFVKHFQNTYIEFPDMPIWVITQIMSFGALSNLYKGLRRKHQKPIAREFGIEAPVLQSWLHTFTYLRNLCAHHSRLWNRTLSIKPKLPLNEPTWAGLNTDRIFACIAILRYLLYRSDTGANMYESWGQAIEELISNHICMPNFDASMGIPANWQQESIWKWKSVHNLTVNDKAQLRSDTMKLYPLKFKPIYQQRIWGGSGLKDYFGKDIPDGVKIGESWELADLPGAHSEIVNGALSGKTIDEVLAMYPRQITGLDNYKPPFPLLIKLLDAQDVLSLQVHPDLATCKRTGKGDPKTECWYMIDVKEGACIYKCLRPGTTPQQFRKAIEDGTCADYLEKVAVKPGECHFLPSGTVHAIGAGLLIAEIQQPSDTTYRVFDWNRIDETTGKGRQLHIEDALESIHFDSSGDNLTVEDTGRLVEADEFKVDKGHREKNNQVLIDAGLMRVMIILTGGGIIEPAGAQTETFTFTRGDTFLIPAAFIGSMTMTDDTQYLTVTL